MADGVWGWLPVAPAPGATRATRAAGRPAGFPLCRRCPFRALERPDVCLACVTSQPAVRRTGPVCPVCEQAATPDGGCTNQWCGRADRWFSSVWAVGPHAAAVRKAISAYKYFGRVEWGEVFGRLLVGFLDDRMPWFDDYDVLTGAPTYTGPGARRSWDHLGPILETVDRLAGSWWPVEPGLVVKRAETPAMAGRSRRERLACAEGPLRRALVVPDATRVAGRRILVVDDVFTEGSTLREIARALALAGAREVAGLVLARQPWTGRRARPAAGAPPSG